MECDQILYALWCGWEDAYPGQKFNKFHSAFCAVRNYVHKYHMAGRVNEESTEAFNSVLERVKNLLKSMKTTVGQVDLMSARMQGNLKVENLEPKRKIAARTTGKKRGPYKVRLETESGEGKLGTTIDSEVELRGKQYFTTPSGLLIPEEWKDV